MAKDIQVIARFSPAEYKMLERAKIETGMTQKAILSRAFALWWKRERKRLAAAE